MHQSSKENSIFMMAFEATRRMTTIPEITPRTMVTLMNTWVLSRKGTPQAALVAFLVTASEVRVCILSLSLAALHRASLIVQEPAIQADDCS